MPRDDNQVEHVRGSIGDCERRIQAAQDALASAFRSLDGGDLDSTQIWLDEAVSQTESAGKDLGTTLLALRVAQERSGA